MLVQDALSGSKKDHQKKIFFEPCSRKFVREKTQKNAGNVSDHSTSHDIPDGTGLDVKRPPSMSSRAPLNDNSRSRSAMNQSPLKPATPYLMATGLRFLRTKVVARQAKMEASCPKH